MLLSIFLPASAVLSGGYFGAAICADAMPLAKSNASAGAMLFIGSSDYAPSWDDHPGAPWVVRPAQEEPSNLDYRSLTMTTFGSRPPSARFAHEIFLAGSAFIRDTNLVVQSRLQ
ncbi:hypothetical protein [Sphingomonas oleivorans]|uniref:hypothetical protein n=1 Tax=Sphingomonas oleivorans TaxID=1735121 RepID=UPI00105753B1|nr:hypothetical protein [Sphingomonas oleivorans]